MIAWSADDLATITGGRWTRPLDPPRVRSRRPGPWCAVGTDTRVDLSGRLFVALRGARHDGHAHLAAAVRAGATGLLVDREVAAPEGAAVLRVADTRTALADLARAHRGTLRGTTVVAVTGSCGKTTTKGMLDAVLAALGRGRAAVRSFNNDIGVPLTILAAQPDDRYLIVEVGTNAPGEIAALARIARPDVAVVTNVGRSHLGGFEGSFAGGRAGSTGSAGGVAAIAREKSALLAALEPPGLAVVCADGPDLAAAVPAGCGCVRFGTSAGADVRLTARGASAEAAWLEVNGGPRFTLGLPGRAMAVNTLAVIAVARRLGLDDAAIAARLTQVRPEPMRLCCETIGARLLVNDAYNANPESMRAAIETFVEITELTDRGRPRVLILGDMLELGDAAGSLHRELGTDLGACCRAHDIAQVVLVGELVRETARMLADAVPVEVFDDLDDAALMTIDALVPRDAQVLLKGSRGIRLERLAEHWAQTRDATGARVVAETA